MDLNNKDKVFFYSESLNFLINLETSFKEKIDYLNNVTFDNYVYKFKNLSKGLEAISKNIEIFTEKCDEKDDNICNMVGSLKNYVDYYIRLCNASTNFNFVTNSNYIKDSMNTLIVVVKAKISFLNKYERLK